VHALVAKNVGKFAGWARHGRLAGGQIL